MAIQARKKSTNKKAVTRTQKHDRRLLAQAELEAAEGRETPALSVVDKLMLAPFVRTGAPFDGGEELRADCSAADLFALVFESPNANADNLLEQALACESDDLQLIEVAAASDMAGCLAEVVARVARRNHYRVKVAIEVARRASVARAEVQS